MKKNVQEFEIKLEKEWIEALDKAYKKVSKNAKVDGFRKGSVPKDIFMKNYGVESLYDEAINMSIDGAYKKLIDENDIKPVIQPTVDVTGVSDTNVIFKFTIISQPEIKLGEYKNLGLKKDSTKVSKKELDEQIEKIISSMADLKVKEGAIVDGDEATIDFDGFVDGKALEGGSGKDFKLGIGSNSFIPGFEEGLVGLKKGDKKTLELKFPENYTEDLKGKDVKFDVVIKEVKEKVMPEINEDLFKDLGYETLKTEEEFRKEIEKELSTNKESEAENAFVDKVLDKAISNMKVELNDEIVAEEIHRLIHQYEDSLKAQGMNIEQFYEMTGTTHEMLHEQLKGEAEKRIKIRYLIEEVAKAEKIENTEKEIKEHIEKLSKEFNMKEEELLKRVGSKELLEYDLKMQKSLTFIKENN